MMDKLLRAAYQARNWRAHFRWAAHKVFAGLEQAVVVTTTGSELAGTMRLIPELRAKVIRDIANKPKGLRGLFWRQELDLGVIARRVITTVGVKFLCDDFNNHSQVVANFKFHEMGTNNTAEAAADTTLGTAVETRATGSQASATASPHATYTTVGTITATAPRAITEHGLFSASSAGTLWDRSVFSVINLATNDAIQFTYVLTAQSGG